MIDLTPIFQALISLIALIITIKVIPWVKAKTTSQQQAILRAAVSVAVYAAEQMYIAGKISNKLNYVKTVLELQGYTVDMNEIEAAVRELTITQNQGVSIPAAELVKQPAE
jgi:hypothetical protein